MTNINDENILLSLKSNGKSKSIEDFNVYEEYLKRFNEKPSSLKIMNDVIDFFDVSKIRKTMNLHFPNASLLFKDYYYSIKYKKYISKKEIWRLSEGYILCLNIDSADMFFEYPKTDIELEDYSEICDFNNIIIPNSSSKNYNKDINNNIINIFEESLIIERDRPTIGMVAVSDGLYVKDFNITEDFKLSYMDLHYGDGFKEFDKKLINKLKNDKKGLVLLHGDPGTGKTYYLRYLLSKLGKKDKSILYLPPTMIESITDPNFVNFINSWVQNSEKPCILLIEDAEPLLISRDDNINGGITNLLNLTDGLLNDFFGIQIIATFNTSLDNLDKALLRPERLIARKEFKPLRKDDGIKLAEKIKIDKSKIKDNMTLAEIYSIKKNNEILLHTVDSEKRKIGY
jgi:hypothetical protein